MACVLACVSGATSAHDTWFQVRAAGGSSTLWLGTGDRYPVLESRVEFEHLQRHGCAPHADVAARGISAGKPLAPVSGPAGRLTQALALRLPSAATDERAPKPHSCWASLVPFDLEIEPAKVEVYLKEIAAGPELRSAWTAQQAAGQAWRERFVKHARIEVGGVSPVALGLQLEAVLTGSAKPKVGEELGFQLLAAGRPLADHPVELVSERSRFGLWRRTDAQGRFALPLPLAGSWLLRSTLLRPPARPGERWQSDFITVAFEVAPDAP